MQNLGKELLKKDSEKAPRSELDARIKDQMQNKKRKANGTGKKGDGIGATCHSAYC